MSLLSLDIHPQQDKVKISFEGYKNFYTCRIYSVGESPANEFSVRFYIDSMHNVVRFKNDVLQSFADLLRRTKNEQHRD